MLRDINRSAATFTAKGEALDDPQQDDDAGRHQSDRCRAGNQTDTCGRNAHQRDGNKESIFAAQPVTQEAEQDRTEWTKTKADSKAGPDQKQLQ